MRIEQCVRYYCTSSGAAQSQETNEDTAALGDDDVVEVDEGHRHYDAFSEGNPPGVKFPGVVKGIETLSRRRQGRLAVSRLPYLEPIGPRREEFYEQKLLLGRRLSSAWPCPQVGSFYMVQGVGSDSNSGLPWHCLCGPTPLENGDLEWRFVWESPVAGLVPQELRLSPKYPVSFEKLSAETEKYIGSVPFLICTCCALEEEKFRCNACMYAVGFHRCQKTGALQWRKGTLHDGPLDFQRVLFNLHRKGIPTTALKTKADEFVANGDMSVTLAETIVRVIEDERGKRRLANEAAGGEAAGDGGRGRVSDRLTLDDIKTELDGSLACPAHGLPGWGWQHAREPAPDL